MQMCHSGVDKFVISRLRTKAPDIKTITVVDHYRSAIKKCWACIVPKAFHVRILYISHDDKLSSFIFFKLPLWPTLRREFMNVWGFLTCPGDKHAKMISTCIALRLPSWSKLMILTIFRLFSRQDSKPHGLWWKIILTFYHSLFNKNGNVYCCWMIIDSPRVNVENCKLYKAVCRRLRDGFARHLVAICSSNATKWAKVRLLLSKPCLFSSNRSFNSS